MNHALRPSSCTLGAWPLAALVDGSVKTGQRRRRVCHIRCRKQTNAVPTASAHNWQTEHGITGRACLQQPTVTQRKHRVPSRCVFNMPTSSSNEDHAPRRCSRGTVSIDVDSSSGMTRLHLGGASQHRARVTCRFFQHQTRMACTHDSVRIFMRAADLGTSQPTAVAAATPAWSTKQGSHTS